MGFDNKDQAMGILRRFINSEVPSRVQEAQHQIASYALMVACSMSPFYSGRFMSSWRISLSEDVGEPSAPGKRSSETQAVGEAFAHSAAAIANIKFGQNFYLGNNVPYAVFVEYGGPHNNAHMITKRTAQAIGGKFGRISKLSSTRLDAGESPFTAANSEEGIE